MAKHGGFGVAGVHVFGLSDAARVLGEMLGRRIPVNTLRTWIKRGRVKPDYKAPGPRGHVYFTEGGLRLVLRGMRESAAAQAKARRAK